MDDVALLDDEVPALKRLAGLIRARRENKGWSQANLASFTNTSRDVIKRLEAGNGDARCSVVFRVLPVLGFTAQDLQKILYGQIGANRVE